MRSSTRKIFAMVLVQVIFIFPVMADEIRLNNGDKISGQLIQIANGTVVMESSALGKVNIPMQEVTSVSTDRVVTVIFNNNDQLTGKLISQGGITKLQSERFGLVPNVQLSDVAAVHGVSAIAMTKPALATSLTKPSLVTDSAAGADQVILKSGDHLVGTIQSITADSVVIDTNFADPITLDRSQVATLNTKDPVTAVFNSGEYLTGTIESSNQDSLQMNTDRAGESEQFQLDEIKSVVRGDPVEIAKAENAVKFTGGLNIGLSRSKGNSDNEKYNGSGFLRARTPKNRYTLNLSRVFERSSGDKTEDETYGAIQYDHFLTDKWYLFNSASFEEDEIQLLNLRTSLAAGAGYQFYERDDLFMSAEFGVGYVNEDFDIDDDSDYIAGRWAFNYDYDWLDWLSIFHNHQGLHSLEDADDVVIRSQSGLRFPLRDGFNATVQANLDWDKSPAAGAVSTDREYIFTLGYGF